MNFYKVENKKISEENDRLRAENIGYWLENSTLKQENQELKVKIEELEEASKQITINNVNVSAEDLAKEVARALNKSEKKEHKCTPECFGKHVIKAIQKDYESCPVVFKATFIKYWYEKLHKEYLWLESLYIIDGKIYFKSKEISI